MAFDARAVWAQGPQVGVRSAWLAMALVASLLVACYVGVRPPNLWSINYYIPSVADGFFRRSLLGTLLTPLGDWRFHYAFIAGLQVAVFTVLMAAVCRGVWRAGWRSGLPVVVYLLGPCGGYLFHVLGYVDQLLFLMLLAMVVSPSRWVVAGMMTAAIFVHEMALFLVLPALAATRWFRGDPIPALLKMLAPALAAFVLLDAALQTTAGERIDRFVSHLSDLNLYAVRTDFYDIYRHEFTGKRMRPYFHKRQILDFVLVVSLAGVLALGMWRARRGVDRWLAALAAGAGACSPLLLGLFGWDSDRWIFLAVSMSVYMVHVLRDLLPTRERQVALALLVAFMVFGNLVYFDSFSPRPLRLDAFQAFVAHDAQQLMTQMPAR